MHTEALGARDERGNDAGMEHDTVRRLLAIERERALAG